MKTIRNITLATAMLLLAAIVTVRASSSHPQSPTTMVNYNVDTALTATDAVSNATGRARVTLRQRGNSEYQRLRVTVAHLDPRSTYTLLAVVGTNDTPIEVTTFRTDSHGAGHVAYWQNTALKDVGHNGSGNGLSKHALPDVIDPLTEVHAIHVADSNGVDVLTAAIAESSAMEFQLAAVFNNTGVDPEAIGCLSVACQGSTMQFRLFAAGRERNGSYTFSVNDTPVATYPADWDGRISIGSLPEGAGDPLEFKTISVTDSAGNEVLRSSLR